MLRWDQTSLGLGEGLEAQCTVLHLGEMFQHVLSKGDIGFLVHGEFAPQVPS